VTDELDDQVRKALRSRRRSRLFPIAVIVFAVCATACAYLWVNYGTQIRIAVFATPQATDPTTARSEPSVGRADFDTFERQTTDSLRSASENLEAQKAALKTLSDQVTDLVAKVDALRNAAATAPASPPIAQTVVPPRPATIVQRKKPQAPKSAGRVSVGGAPLPIAPPSDR
jgi:cytoskeletal protein RodZ